MILSRAARLMQLYWQGKLYAHAEKMQLPIAQSIMCGEATPYDQSEDYHVAIVSSKCNQLYYLSQFDQQERLRLSLLAAEVAEAIRITQLVQQSA
jgi:hypothetical protein